MDAPLPCTPGLLAARVALQAEAIAAGWLVVLRDGLALADAEARAIDFVRRFVHALAADAPSPAELHAEAMALARLHRDRGGGDAALSHLFALEGLILEAMRREVARAPHVWSASDVADLTARLHDRLREVAAAFAAILREATAADQRAHRDRLARFAHDLSHELKNRLGVATLAATMLGEALESADLGRAHALDQRLRQILGQLRGATGELLAVASARAGGVVEASARRPLRDLLADLRREFEVFAEAEGVALEVPDDAPAVTVDAGRVRLVVANLLHNAIKFSDRAKAERWVRLAVAPAGPPDTWRVDVSDNGVGVPAAARDRIFNAGFRADTSAPGQGLGLAIARQAALQLGGYLWVTSQTGRGSTFSFTFRALQGE